MVTNGLSATDGELKLIIGYIAHSSLKTPR
jgi:hypothetical protein